MAQSDKKKVGFKVPKLKIKEAKAYALEFVLMLAGVLALLSIVGYMFNTVLSHVADVDAGNLLGTWQYEMSISAIAGLLIVLPVTAVLFVRTKKREKKTKDVLEGKVRRNFLNIFLALLFGLAVIATVRLSTALLSALLNIGLNQETTEPLWVSSLRRLFEVGLYGGVFGFFYRNKKAGAKEEKEVRRFMVGSGGLITLLVILLAALPLNAQRNSAIDDQIEQDLRSIQSQVSDYFGSDGRLPASLEDLSLDSDLKKRADKHDYSYQRLGSYSYAGQFELCAVFKTDTTDDESDSYDIFSARSVYGGDEISKHNDGRDCFELDTYGSSFSPSSSAAFPTESFNLDSLEGLDLQELLPALDSI